MFQIVKRHLFHRNTEQKHALLCDADSPNGIHPHNPRPSGIRKVFTCLKKTTLTTQLLHEMSRRDRHSQIARRGSYVDWIQEQLDVSEELEWAFREKLANTGKERGPSRRIHVSVHVDHAL